jgi:hypothetical protein
MSRSAKLAATALALALLTEPATARVQEEPVMGRTPDAQDVAMTPVTDLNLKKDEIPPVLIAAAINPYASVDLKKCTDIASAIALLDGALGPDMDVAQTDPDKVSAGAVAKSVVASFIPFRGVIRELTGAADHQREFEAAIYAGAVRRGFLKGLGQQMNCPYPSRPAFAQPAVARQPAKSAKKDREVAASADPNSWVAQPVVQGEAPNAPKRRR